MPGSRLVGEFGKIRTGAQTNLQLCRLPVRPQVRPGPTDTGPVAKCSREDTSTFVTTGLSGPAVHVPDRSADSHRKTSSLRPTTHETHSVASQEQLVSTGISRKGHPFAPISASSLAMVARGKQCPHPPTITPHKACSANIYRRIKRMVGHSLKRIHCKRILVGSGKQATHKLSRAQSSVFGPQGVPKSLCRQNSSSSNQQYYSGCLHKQRRRHEVRPSMCPTVENLDMVLPAASDAKSATHPRPLKCNSRQTVQVLPAASDAKSATHPRPLKCNSRQTVQAGSDHPDRVVPTSRSLSSDMQPMAPASDRSICHGFNHKLPQFVSPVPDSLAVAVDALTLPWEDLDAYAFPPTALLGKVVEKLLDSPCKRIILIAPGWPNMPWFWDLVTMSSQVPLSLPNRPDLLTQPFNQIPHRNLTNLNLHAWLLEPQQSKNRASH